VTVPSLDDRTARELRGLARVLVRSGYADGAQVRTAVAEAVREDAPNADPVTLTEELVAQAIAELRLDAAGWPERTDTDRLDDVLAELERRGLLVLRYCSDHHDARRTLEDASGNDRGIAFFTDTDVWHAVDFGMLELKLWHADTANVAPGDALLDDVLGLLAEHDLPATFDEGRVEITLDWRRRGEWV
jgi:Domain of unknown function (DUF6891)